MTHRISRREFLAAGAAAGLGLYAARGQAAEAPAFKTKLYKAMIGKPTEDYLKKLKAAGFDGIETNAWSATPDEAKACREVAEKLGTKIHAVLRGWMAFNSTDPATVAKSIAETETALRAAQGYGADAILLVPCRIGGKDMAMPEAWEFQLEFDEKTGHLSKVAAGDNARYKAYIDAHNQAVDGSIAAVRKLIPVAEQTKVVIALENVWNNLWVKPAYFKSFVASFANPWVKAYFDIGNHVKYAPAEEWIKALGPLLAKCHVKDFKLNPDGHGGKFIDIRDGSVNWPVVRKALDDVGYSGWMTIEGGGLSLEEHSKRLDLIIAGQ
ncbi:MAG: sugar phosphate isomerase/epimerase [Planctomycetes bacterium]|nr:sugar phosphate isomerase/epimerase [Planctomycetota bacterium]